MAITIDYNTKIIHIPKDYLTQKTPILFELDVNKLRLDLKLIEEGVGMTYPDTHRHNTQVLLAGVTYARSVEIINGYTLTFEDGQYVVACVGANHNLSDVKNLNQVSLIVGNSAGLVVASGGASNAPTASEISEAVWNAPLSAMTDSTTIGGWFKGNMLTVAKFLGLK